MGLSAPNTSYTASPRQAPSGSDGGPNKDYLKGGRVSIGLEGALNVGQEARCKGHSGLQNCRWSLDASHPWGSCRSLTKMVVLSVGCN
jgi:hypothetical protein